tara:strand:- start:5058 stop:5255 length:198 start_codon:yes stop_codon:yes gene_type:complete
MANPKVKIYTLRIIFDATDDELLHLEESFSDNDLISLLIGNDSLEVSNEFREILSSLDTDICGLT